MELLSGPPALISAEYRKPKYLKDEKEEIVAELLSMGHIIHSICMGLRETAVPVLIHPSTYRTILLFFGGTYGVAYIQCFRSLRSFFLITFRANE